ncbi:MAG TPA: S26 family signal peptidase [Solirubrobacteraceae bacterium]
MIHSGKRLPEEDLRESKPAHECMLPAAIAIPPEDCFMMGDDRGTFDDSRFGDRVPRDWIAGRAYYGYNANSRAGDR